MIDTVVSGHVHKWGEYDFSFRDFAEEEDFRRDLGQVFERAISGEMTGEELYEAVHEELWHRYHLGAHIITRRVIGTGPTDPGPIVSEFNRDSLAYGQERGTLFVNIPAVGPASSTSPAGYMAMDIEPNGRTRITPYFYFREPDGTLLRGTGQELPELRRQHAERVVQWQRSVGMTVTDPTIPTGVPQMTVSGPRAVEDWTVDWLPLLCQYPRGKICFAVGIEPLWNMSGQEFGFAVTPFQMTIPLSDRHSPVWGVNYLRLGVDYSTITDWDFRVNLGLGLVEPYVQSGFRFGQGDRQYYGGGVLLGGASAMVVPAIDLNATFSEDLSNYNVQLGLRWYWDWISIQPSGHSH